MFALAAECAFSQQRQATRFTLPDDVVLRKVDILSEGARMGGEVCSLKSMAGKKLPTIVMSHGWGGTVGGLRRDAAAFAQAGTHPVEIRGRIIRWRRSTKLRSARCSL